MKRAVGALERTGGFTIPGAVPQADIKRAFGPKLTARPHHQPLTHFQSHPHCTTCDRNSGSHHRLRQSKLHYSKFSGQPRMDANAREYGVNILIASDSRRFAFIRGFRFSNHAARTFAERGERRGWAAGDVGIAT